MATALSKYQVYRWQGHYWDADWIDFHEGHWELLRVDDDGWHPTIEDVNPRDLLGYKQGADGLWTPVYYAGLVPEGQSLFELTNGMETVRIHPNGCALAYGAKIAIDLAQLELAFDSLFDMRLAWVAQVESPFQELMAFLE